MSTLTLKMPSSLAVPKREQRPYAPHGSAIACFSAKDPEVLYEGPAGTGKTRTVLEKVWATANKYAGCRILLCRKTRASMTSTVLVTFEDEVIPEGHPCLKGAVRENRSVYRLPNKSEIDIKGLDDPLKIMSSQYDVIYVAEATECTESDVEMLSTRLRNGVIPYQQLIMDCNPDSPSHWLNVRANIGRCRRICSTHKDNPRYWDSRVGDWTNLGAQYIDRLRKSLTGARLKRLLDGVWAAPEGARFEYVSRATHAFNLRETFRNGIAREWKKWGGLDYGFSDPFCLIKFVKHPSGDIYAYSELYERNMTADDQAKLVLARTGEFERIDRIYGDPSMWHELPYQQLNRHLGKPSLPPPATSYHDVFKNDPLRRVGAFEPGARMDREKGMIILDRYLGRDNGFPDLYIEESLVNFWREIENAVNYKNPRTGIVEEYLDEKCEDHALTAAYYGLSAGIPGSPTSKSSNSKRPTNEVPSDTRKTPNPVRPTRTIRI